MGSRTWVKLYCNKWLEGSIRKETPLVRAVFIDLLALAGAGEYSDAGKVGLKNGVGLTNQQFMTLLSLSKNQWIFAKNRLQNTGRIAVDPSNVITIINWKKYQSEYNRQRPYRNRKLQPQVTQENKKENKKEKDNNQVIYKKDGTIDEHNTIICHQSLWKIKQILNGKIQASEANKKRYRQELKKLGIEL